MDSSENGSPPESVSVIVAGENADRPFAPAKNGLFPGTWGLPFPVSELSKTKPPLVLVSENP